MTEIEHIFPHSHMDCGYGKIVPCAEAPLSRGSFRMSLPAFGLALRGLGALHAGGGPTVWGFELNPKSWFLRLRERPGMSSCEF